jgi:hypothetical protein
MYGYTFLERRLLEENAQLKDDLQALHIQMHEVMEVNKKYVPKQLSKSKHSQAIR